MDVHPGRRIVADASVDRDAGHLDGDPDRQVRFRELGLGFPWAWDEEVAAGAARLPAHRSERLAAACPVAEDAIAEEANRRGVSRAAGREREWSDV